jgi:hypothetical protein
VESFRLITFIADSVTYNFLVYVKIQTLRDNKVAGTDTQQLLVLTAPLTLVSVSGNIDGCGSAQIFVPLHLVGWGLTLLTDESGDSSFSEYTY